MNPADGKRLRILHLIPIDGVGGVEVAIRSMLDAEQPNLDFRLLLIAGATVARGSKNVVESRFASPNNPLAHWRALRIILRQRPEILICSLWRSVPAALMAKLIRPRMRLVLFLHAERAVHVLDRSLSKLGMLAADEIWCDSRATAEKRVPPKQRKQVRIISFVTRRLRPQTRAAGPEPHFVIWARLTRQKGIDRALRFIAALVQCGVEATYDVYGPDGGELPHLEAQRDQLGLFRRVRFHGPAPHESLPEIAASASFFLQLSRFEGMGMGVVEAMQLGLVPIVTPVGEFARYVADGENGLIADPEDLGAAAERVAALCANEQEYRRLREAAIATWQQTSLYAEDVARGAKALLAE